MITAADDDDMLDSLGSALPVALDELGALLLGWRRRGDAGPVPSLIDTDAAVDLVVRARQHREVVMRFVSMARAAAAAGCVVAALLAIGLFIAPVVTWWWAVPALGVAALAGTYVIVESMKPDDWTTRELDDNEDQR